MMLKTTAIRKFLRCVAWLPLVVSAAVCMAQAQSAPARSPAEEKLFDLTNAARSEQGLSPLQWDDSLAQAAKAHAALILQNSQLSHQYSGEADVTARAGQAGAHFQTIAENMAQGSSADSIQKEWMNSPPHRANILDANLNAVAFSVVKRGDTLYAVADFAHILPSLSNDQVEAAIAKLLTARGIQIGESGADARKTCEMDTWSAPAQVAQLAEHSAVNRRVVGSSPTSSVANRINNLQPPPSNNFAELRRIASGPFTPVASFQTQHGRNRRRPPFEHRCRARIHCVQHALLDGCTYTSPVVLMLACRNMPCVSFSVPCFCMSVPSVRRIT
jgi:hypothetical protein